MRQYIFRGQRKDTKEWVYGSLIQNEEGAFILDTRQSITFTEPEYHYQGMGCGLEDRNIIDRYEAMQHGWECAIERCLENYPPFIEVIPETVGQFTGIQDKNNNPIYEGDIVQFISTESYEYDENFDYEKLGDKPVRGIMQWNDEACGWRSSSPSRFKVTKSMLEVIGNQFENPELLNQ